jgi:zinc transport system substrate-binding protein
MKKPFVLLVLLLLVFLLVSCNGNAAYDVVVTHYAQYDFVKTIGGDDIAVGMAIAPGVEAHGYEPTSQNIVAINRARLFVYTSDIFDPWAKAAVDASNTTTVVLDLSTKIDVDAIDHDHAHLVQTTQTALSPTLLEEDDHATTDPHYWTDPVVAMQMVDALIEQLVVLWPEHAEAFTLRGEALHDALNALYEEIGVYMDSIPEEARVIYHAGHVNLAYFAARYHLTVVSLTDQYAPDGDPTSAQIAQMIERLRLDGATYLFYEELSEAQVAKTIQNELKPEGIQIELLLFHGVHNVTLEDFEDGVSYLELMEANFANLRTALSGSGA